MAWVDGEYTKIEVNGETIDGNLVLSMDCIDCIDEFNPAITKSTANECGQGTTSARVDVLMLKLCSVAMIEVLFIEVD